MKLTTSESQINSQYKFACRNVTSEKAGKTKVGLTVQRGMKNVLSQSPPKID